MKPELELSSQADLDIVEAGHWLPPQAPLEMPEQQLERVAATGRGWRLWPLVTQRQRA